MKLKRILQNLEGIKSIEGKTSLDIRGIACDSKAVRDGYLFIAVKGSRFNGTDFINEAIDRGASAVILEHRNRNGFTFRRGVTFIYIGDARLGLSKAALAFYGDISKKMHLYGVTGTNGKTTITYLLESLFKVKKERTGVIGTINYRFGGRLIPSVNTTPGVLGLYSLLNSMHKEGIENCVLEVSSHSLEQGRVDTLSFDAAIFTNLTSEHLDYHENMENYLSSKMILFTKLKENGYAVVNKDDPYSEKIINRVKQDKRANVLTYGIDTNADVVGKDISFSLEGLRFTLCAPEANRIIIESRLIGRHNIYNILAAAACGIAMGMEMRDIKAGIEAVSILPGRLEKIDCGQDFMVFVDYAHTEDGLKNALNTLRELRPARLLTVFGCGGERDKSKRPKMGEVSAKLSDKIFITSDNPRGEDPEEIVRQIAGGICGDKDKYVIEIDRFKAIDAALKEAKKGDMVLVAGKGHEAYQIFKDLTFPFDDREVVKRILKEERICSQSKIS